MRKLVLLGIIVLAFLLRVVALDRFPVGFTPDEASFGYDAYSLLKTGKDQWGQSFPLTLESFGDFKPPLYAYLTIPFVWLLGLTKVAVRLPNALLGTAAVYVTYLLAFELLRKIKSRSRITDHPARKSYALSVAGERSLASVAALLLAISPWHIMMSRGAFEANLTTFFLPLGFYLLVRGLKEEKFLIWSGIIFGLNLFTYHSARLVTPLLLVLVVFLFRKELRKISRNRLLAPVIVLSIFLIVSIFSLFQGGARRATDISIFGGALSEASEQRTAAILQGLNPGIARLFHNKYQVVARRFLHNYTQYTSYDFLFKSGPAETTYGMIPGRGVLYWFELPLFIGFIYALFRKRDKRLLLIIMAWILIAPIPAALTTGKGFAANRAVIMLPALQMMSAVGAAVLYQEFKSRWRSNFAKHLLLYGSMVTLLIFFVYFLEDYFLLSPLKSGQGMLHGNLEAAEWLFKNSFDKAEVVVSKRLSEPHIYIAFANSWDTTDYQKHTKDWARYRKEGFLFLDMLGEYRLGRYTFRDIQYDVDQNITNALLVGRPNNFPKDVIPIITIYYPDGEPSVLIVDPEDQLYAKATN